MTVAMVFPGQGSQSIGMMSGFADSRVVRDTFAEASEALRQDLWDLAQNGPAEALNDTVNTQPLMLAAGTAVYRAWRDAGGATPVLMAGHSLGEYAALVAAEVIEFADAIQLVRFRAQAMSRAGQGAMAAILGLDRDAVEKICRDAAQGEVLQPANYNTAEQIVVAGSREAIARAVKLAAERGAKRVVMLPVSGPFHSALMQSAADELRDYLKDADVFPPKIPVLHNADLETHADPAEIKDALIRQVCNQVRWVETIELMVKANVAAIVESGPGKVLTGLNKRIAPKVRTVCLYDMQSLSACLQEELR
jgi:[acyl-carrier-protein] S-malonyltransferase